MKWNHSFKECFVGGSKELIWSDNSVIRGLNNEYKVTPMDRVQSSGWKVVPRIERCDDGEEKVVVLCL